jgi:hypothetical protein
MFVLDQKRSGRTWQIPSRYRVRTGGNLKTRLSHRCASNNRHSAEAPLDERGSLGGDRALWRFHPGRLVPRRIGVPRPSRPERHDRSITVDEGSSGMVGVVIWAKVMAVNCIDNNGPPWRR